MNEQWFWEQCGGIHVDYNENDGCPAHYRMPDGVCLLDTDKPNLNSLFKYAVPELASFSLSMDSGSLEDSGHGITLHKPEIILYRASAFLEGYFKDEELEVAIVIDKDPAQAVFGAIYKAFGGK